MVDSQLSIPQLAEQSQLPKCEHCGAQLVLKGPPSKRRLNPICPNCGARLQWRCSWCKKLFLPTCYKLSAENHFCCDEHQVHFSNEWRGKQKGADRAARRAIPRQCARKGSIHAPGVRENPELLKDCPVIFRPRRNGQDFCSRECQRIQWWIENYDEQSVKVREKSRREYEKRVAAKRRKSPGRRADDNLGATIDRLYEAKKGDKPEVDKGGWSEIKTELDAKTGVHRSVDAYQMRLKRYRSRRATN